VRVAYIAPEFFPIWGGVGSYSIELVKRLSMDPDLEMHIITPKREMDAKAIEQKFDSRIKVHFLSSASDSFIYNFKLQASMFMNFQKLHKQYKFDLVHAANLVHMPDIFMKFRQLDIPQITTVHTTLKSQSTPTGKVAGSKTFFENLTAIAYPYIKLMERLYLKRSQHLIAVSHWINSFIDNRAHVINNGIDTQRFSGKDSIRLDNSDRPVILYSGRLLAIKGLDTLFEAMRIVLGQRKAYFVFAGTGDIKKWKKHLSDISEKNYAFLGHVPYEMMHQVYGAASVFVLPSHTESFPLTILEAMSSGLPIVASNVGGVPEILTHNKDGVLVKPGDAQKLAVGIMSILDDPALSRTLSLNARMKALENYDSRIMAAKTKEFYRRVMK